MNARDFTNLLRTLPAMTATQRERVRAELAQQLPTAGERARAPALGAGRVSCPNRDCAALEPMRWGRVGELQRYRCRACGKTFTERTGPNARMRQRAWESYARAVATCGAPQVAAAAGVHRSTAYRWRQRVQAFDARQPAPSADRVAAALKALTDELEAASAIEHCQRTPGRRGRPVRSKSSP